MKNSAGRAEERQDGFVNPYKLHSLWWSDHLSLRHALNDHLDHGRSTRQHDMAYKSLRMSTIMWNLKEVSWNPLASLPKKAAPLKKAVLPDVTTMACKFSEIKVILRLERGSVVDSTGS